MESRLTFSESPLFADIPLATLFGLVLPFLVWLGFGVPAMVALADTIGSQHAAMLAPLILFALYAVTTDRDAVFRASGTMFVVWGLVASSEILFAVLQSSAHDFLAGYGVVTPELGKPPTLGDMIGMWWSLERSLFHLR